MGLTPTEFEKRKQSRSDALITLPIQIVSAYATGKVVGGKFTIGESANYQGPYDETGLSAILQSLAVFDPSGQALAMDLFFFNQDLATPLSQYADTSVFTPTDADMLNCIGLVRIAAADYLAAGQTSKIAAGSNQANLGKVLKPAAGKKIWCIPVARATATFTIANLYFRFQFSNGL